MIYVGLDDTDVLESRGTGHLARAIAGELAQRYPLAGVTRHQLLRDPRIACTKNNSSAAILFAVPDDVSPAVLFEQVSQLMLADAVAGSDPGLCVASDVPAPITAFGRRTQREIVTQAQALWLAEAHGIMLTGLGGDHSGVIGALAAVGLAASGDDGRYVLVGRSRELRGLQPVSALLAAGIAAVETIEGDPVMDGLIQTDRLRPARRRHMPIAIVEQGDGCWIPLKLD